PPAGPREGSGSATQSRSAPGFWRCRGHAATRTRACLGMPSQRRGSLVYRGGRLAPARSSLRLASNFLNLFKGLSLEFRRLPPRTACLSRAYLWNRGGRPLAVPVSNAEERLKQQLAVAVFQAAAWRRGRSQR